MAYQNTYQDWKEDKVRIYHIKELLQFFAPDCRKKIIRDSEAILFKIGNEVAENYKASFDGRAYKSLTFPMVERLVKKEYGSISRIIDKPIDRKILESQPSKYVYYANGVERTIRDISKIQKWIRKFKEGAYNSFVAECPNIPFMDYQIKQHFQAYALIKYHAYLKKYSTWEIGLFKAIEGKYIASDSSFPDFKRMLSGEEETLLIPIKWIDKRKGKGNKHSLFYFIKILLPEIHKLKRGNYCNWIESKFTDANGKPFSYDTIKVSYHEWNKRLMKGQLSDKEEELKTIFEALNRIPK